MIMKQKQMLFHGSDLSMESESLELIDLFASGIHWLGLLSKEKAHVHYSDWIKLVKAARPKDHRLNDKKLLLENKGSPIKGLVKRKNTSP